MAGERTFTEGEAYALVEDAVKRETAAVQTQVATLETQVTTLGNEKDALELRAKAAEDKAAEAEKALEDFKSDVESQKAAEARWAEREKTVKEVAPKLELTDERRERITAMADADFEKYLEDIRVVAGAAPADDKVGADGKPVAPVTEPPAGGAPPRQSAAFGGGGGPSDKGGTTPVMGLIGARRALGKSA